MFDAIVIQVDVDWWRVQAIEPGRDGQLDGGAAVGSDRPDRARPGHVADVTRRRWVGPGHAADRTHAPPQTVLSTMFRLYIENFTAALQAILVPAETAPQFRTAPDRSLAQCLTARNLSKSSFLLFIYLFLFIFLINK